MNTQGKLGLFFYFEITDLFYLLASYLLNSLSHLTSEWQIIIVVSGLIVNMNITYLGWHPQRSGALGLLGHDAHNPIIGLISFFTLLFNIHPELPDNEMTALEFPGGIAYDHEALPKIVAVHTLIEVSPDKINAQDDSLIDTEVKVSIQ